MNFPGKVDHSNEFPLFTWSLVRRMIEPVLVRPGIEEESLSEVS